MKNRNQVLSPWFAQFPDFEGFDVKEQQKRIEGSLLSYQQVIDRVCKVKKVSWESVVIPLDIADFELSNLWSPMRHLNSVANSDQLRQVYNQLKVKINHFYTQLGQNRRLYNVFKKLSKIKSLNKVEKKIIADNLRSFKLSGVALAKDKQQQFKTIQKKLTKLSVKFSENILDCTQAWSLLIDDKKKFAGIPNHIIEIASKKAKDSNQKGWLFTLDFPIYHAVISYADNRSLREVFYKAYVTRASLESEHNEKYDNSLIIEQILDLKKEKANLLRFKSYADYSIVDKMAQSPKKVNKFLKKLAKKSRKGAKNDLIALTEFAKQEFNVDKLEVWDVAYYSEKQKEALFNINDEMLQPYFSEERVVHGLFSIVKSLYGINIEEVPNSNTWDQHVRLYCVLDGDGSVYGYFYLDLYIREGKRAGAWMDECSNRIKINAKQYYPVAYLTCNLTPPVGDKPALFTHNEVITLFHEFGHGLHHILTKVDYPSVAGINGVEWDAVELPSQFMENWCWDKKTINLISGHYKTQKSLPVQWVDALIKAKNYQSGMQMLRQVEFSLFDMNIHQKYRRETKNFVQETLDSIRKKYSLVTPPSYNKFQNSFSHIFAGGYSSGYYSYKWAEVLSADVFSAFEKVGLNHEAKVREVGQRFLENILQRGGSASAIKLFKKFRGRKPKTDALLRHNGIN